MKISYSELEEINKALGVSAASSATAISRAGRPFLPFSVQAVDDRRLNRSPAGNKPYSGDPDYKAQKRGPVGNPENDPQKRGGQKGFAYVFQENSATLRIRTIFRRPADQPNDDDDQNKNKTGQATPTPKDPNNDLKDGDTVVIWTDTDDCGFDFRTGETYLVYAIENEQDTRLETSACTRTARVSDSGEDLAYLYFYQNGGAQSARLEGFATSDVRKLSPDRFHYTGRIDSPVSGIRVELQSGHNSFATTPDANGRFVFDGLAEGEYKLFAYPRDTERSKPLAPPVTLRIQAKSCTSTVLFVPKTN